MYEAVHAYPDGGATAARHAREAASLGYDGVVVRNHGDDPADYDAGAAAEEFDVDVVEGVEVRTDDRSQAAGLVGRFREEATLVCVHGGTPSINRYAVEDPRVDVLAHPMRGEGDVNHVLARAAAENGVRLEFSLADVLRADGGPRVRAISGLGKLRELVADADARFVVSADPFTHLDWRGHRELVAVGELVGFDAGQVRAGLREWGRLAARNRERASESFMEPGVRRGRYEEEP
ncbi:ribonuclease P [Halobacteriales archaeon QS_5_70_15]|nr:MAG: ribonuclease P [Halobacteriales archaeon QS_5_70_15]